MCKEDKSVYAMLAPQMFELLMWSRQMSSTFLEELEQDIQTPRTSLKLHYSSLVFDVHLQV